MLRKVILIAFASFITAPLFSQDIAPVDTVISFTFGDNTVHGQSAEYFPENVFGWPSANARRNVATTSPDEIVALGLGGEIILGWNDRKLVDTEGYDFTIYENAFEYFKGIYTEPAIVSVSMDGDEWHTFEHDSLTLEGMAGTYPTLGDMDVTVPGAAGGNSFDLADLGLYEIRYVKIIDVSEIILNNPDHPNYDFTINGFDLDALVGYSLVPDGTSVFAGESDLFKLDLNQTYNVFDLSGKSLGLIKPLEIDFDSKLVKRLGKPADKMLLIR